MNRRALHEEEQKLRERLREIEEQKAKAEEEQRELQEKFIIDHPARIRAAFAPYHECTPCDDKDFGNPTRCKRCLFLYVEDKGCLPEGVTFELHMRYVRPK